MHANPPCELYEASGDIMETDGATCHCDHRSEPSEISLRFYGSARPKLQNDKPKLQNDKPDTKNFKKWIFGSIVQLYK